MRRTKACRSDGATCARHEGAPSRRTGRTSAAPRSPRVRSWTARRGPSSRSCTWVVNGGVWRRRWLEPPEAGAGRPVGRPVPWEWLTDPSRQRCPEGAQDPSWGRVKTAVRPRCRTWLAATRGAGPWTREQTASRARRRLVAPEPACTAGHAGARGRASAVRRGQPRATASDRCCLCRKQGPCMAGPRRRPSG